MIKRDIATQLYETHGGFTVSETERYTNEILDILKQAMESGEPITITGFGRFRPKKKAVREIVLPNGRKHLSASGERVQFLPSPKLKSFLNAEP